MNRQIKFRAWDAKEDKMHVPDYPFIGGGSGALDICLTIDGKIKTPNSYGLDYGFTPPVPELVMMQFTGLTDKNGKDIYEAACTANKFYNITLVNIFPILVG